LKKSHKKIVFTNGCFDLLHPGHIDYMAKAKELGDYLIVGLNSDASVKRLKGEDRPVNSQEVRKIMLEALSSVDAVEIFDEDTPYNLIKRISPDILVKGGDYNVEDIVGREFAKETKTIPFLEGFSTTTLIERIKKAYE
ncbi:MAG: D-glycero-beta-D-manno-heptose 1-phosphate adenylyltransferase, partial [Campylobacterales bacterium]|nr:D-glycero-beta-D-manno-heptose 1-phosphate adenylyltransferase [Campylobacterales bacterium]